MRAGMSRAVTSRSCVHTCTHAFVLSNSDNWTKLAGTPTRGCRHVMFRSLQTRGTYALYVSTLERHVGVLVCFMLLGMFVGLYVYQGVRVVTSCQVGSPRQHAKRGRHRIDRSLPLWFAKRSGGRPETGCGGPPSLHATMQAMISRSKPFVGRAASARPPCQEMPLLPCPLIRRLYLKLKVLQQRHCHKPLTRHTCTQ